MMKKIAVLFLLMVVYLNGNCQTVKKPIPDNLVVLTFDDAVVSHYSIVAPLLKKYGFGATFFVCEFPSQSSDKPVYMNWKQIEKLSKMGFDIANHTLNHIPASKVPKDLLIDELKYIEYKCDSMNIKKPSSFAYPGYDLNASVLETLEEKGYKFARAGGSRAYNPLKDHPLLVPSWSTNADNKEQIMAAFNEAKNGMIVVLTIHGVPDIEHPWVNTPIELFKEYLHYLSEHNFNVISIRDLNDYVDVERAMENIMPDLKKELQN
ncbi:MAG: polysaccharide deacetylase family protein [Candidatus Saccharimonadaceae bacterium]